MVLSIQLNYAPVSIGIARTIFKKFRENFKYSEIELGKKIKTKISR